jgi:hypothetical protein
MARLRQRESLINHSHFRALRDDQALLDLVKRIDERLRTGSSKPPFLRSWNAQAPSSMTSKRFR